MVAPALEFAPLPLANVRLFHGKEFPIAFQHTSSDVSKPSVEAGASFLRQLAASGELTRLLNEHGAILFRGFGTPSAETFSALVTAAEEGRGNKPHEQVGLAGKRSEQAKNVHSANEGPPTQRFFQHNEYARYTRHPGFIHFYCETAPVTGGESPIANSLELFERVNAVIPEFVQELKKRGLSMKQVFPAPYHNDGKSNYFDWTGADSFGHDILPGDDLETQRRKAEVQVRRLTDEFAWREDGGIDIVQHVPAVRVFRSTGTDFPTWFNGLAGRHGTATAASALEAPYHGTDGNIYPPATYGDGTTIPRHFLDTVLAITQEVEFVFKWEAGDLVLVNNHRTSHGRAPWSDGPRKVLVSMWDELESLGKF